MDATILAFKMEISAYAFSFLALGKVGYREVTLLGEEITLTTVTNDNFSNEMFIPSG